LSCGTNLTFIKKFILEYYNINAFPRNMKIGQNRSVFVHLNG
jgi:predicted DNA-binding transcriptional regulator AlpA